MRPALERLVVIGAATPTIIRLVEDINKEGTREIELAGFLDNAFATLGSDFFGFKILGGFEAIDRFPVESVVLINTIAGTIGSRVETTGYFLSRGYQFTNIIHPGVNTNHVALGKGNLVYENALIQPFVNIGSHCVVSSNSGIAHESSIEDYCFIGPASYVCGKVKIGQRVFVGAGARILPRLTIGPDATIGACTLVDRSVGDGARILGVPGRRS